MRAKVCLVLIPLMLAGCTHPSSNTYEAADVGRTIETTKASVVSSRIVEISGEKNMVGPGVGGATAAATTGIFVNGGSAGLISLLAGIVGAGVGYLTQEKLNDREGIEYVLKVDDDRTVTLVQNREDEEEPIADGTPVLVQLNGRYTRVIPDTTIEDASNEAWIDPDKRAMIDTMEDSGGQALSENLHGDPDPSIVVPSGDDQQ
ncbi:MAG: hypothetical protein ACR2QF_01955 [Geminicoccaceae bacterium]